MNTKIIVALVIGIAVIGLTGAASADPGLMPEIPEGLEYEDSQPEPGDYESITETYGFTKTVGGDDFVDIGTVTSGTYFYESPILGDTTIEKGESQSELMGIIENTLVDTWVVAVDECSDPYEATLTQQGIITAFLNVPEVKELPEFNLYVEKAQRLVASGQFELYGAQFKDCAEVGTNYWDPIRSLDGIKECGNCHLEERSNALAGVWTSKDAMFAEVDMGTKSWTSLDAVECVNACEEAVLLGGSSMAYSSFGGESIVGEGGQITTGAGVITSHGWNSGTGWSGEPPLCP